MEACTDVREQQLQELVGVYAEEQQHGVVDVLVSELVVQDVQRLHKVVCMGR